jgi:hypothetical protein
LLLVIPIHALACGGEGQLICFGLSLNVLSEPAEDIETYGLKGSWR